MSKSCHRFKPPALIIAALLGFGLAAELAPAEAQTRSIPIRWCIVAGAPADINPGAVGEPDTDNVAWRRHERISESTYIPQADVTLRSSLWNIVESSELNFPIIPDQDSTNPNHQPGDVLDPVSASSDEWDLTYQACVDAWEDLEVDDLGVVAVIARRIVDNDGNQTVFAWGWNGARRTLLEDNAWSLCGSTLNDVAICDGVDKTFGHEVGHTLPTAGTDVTNTDGLRHTCVNSNMMRSGRRDTTGDNILDNFNLNNTATQITDDGEDDTDCSDDDTTEVIDQPEAIYAAAADVPGCMNAGTNTPCGTQRSDVQTDARADADLSAIDLASLRIVDNSDGTTQIVHELYGRIDPTLLPNNTLEYFAFLNLDNNPATGGTPADLGLATNFQGAELVTRVQVTTIAIPLQPERAGAVPPLFGTVHTVWRFENNQFVEVENPDIRSRVNPLIAVGELPDGSSRTAHTADRIEITIPSGVRGPIAVPLRIQGLSRATPQGGGGSIDKLDDTSAENGAPLRLRFPKFPVCQAIPSPTFAGGLTTVEVSGLIPEKGVHVVFGPKIVANGMANASGAASVSFAVPDDAAAGKHLITVGTDGTALTADCIVELTKRKIRYEYAAKMICGTQPSTRSMRMARGFYATSINIHNPGPGVATLFKKLALVYPPGGQKPGKIIPFSSHRLDYDTAVSVDCDMIQRDVFSGRLPQTNIEGFVVIQSDQSLDVDAVYTTATLNAEGTAEDHSSIVVRRVEGRVIEAPDKPKKKADLTIRDIDLGSLRVDCPKGGGSCIATVDVTIANIGDRDAGPFKTEVLFDPRQMQSVIDQTPTGLPAGAAKTFPVKTGPNGNCFDPDCTICATVDAGNDVAEADEGNNRLCRTKSG